MSETHIQHYTSIGGWGGGGGWTVTQQKLEREVGKREENEKSHSRTIIETNGFLTPTPTSSHPYYCAIFSSFFLFHWRFFFLLFFDSLLYPIHLTVSLFLFKTLSWRVCCISLLISRRRLSMLLSSRISFSRMFFCSIILEGPVNSSAIRRFWRFGGRKTEREKQQGKWIF